MKYLLPVIALIATFTECLPAAPLVKNSDFTARTPEDENRPANWHVPDASAWRGTNEDGFSGQDSARYRTPRWLVSGPVTQSISLPAKTDLVLTAAVKRDNSMKPIVRIVSGKEGRHELVRIVAVAQPGRWNRYVARFKSGAATTVAVQIWADARHMSGKKTPGGTVAVDDVQVLTASEARTVLDDAGQTLSYENVARGALYTLQPNPSYRLCKDDGDKTQLTDGQYSVGYFWTQMSTVGWAHSNPVVITMDLGDDFPIRGISYNTAAGVAGVQWPSTIQALISADGRAFYSLGNLVKLSEKNGTHPEEGYAVHRYYTDELQTHGRFIKLLIDPNGPYCFIDEIEVHRGKDEWKKNPLPGEVIRYPMEYYKEDLFNAAVKRRMGLDLVSVQNVLDAAEIPAADRANFAKEIAAIERAIDELPEIDSKTFRGAFPFHAVHARVYAILGAFREVVGRPEIVAWPANPWDFLTTVELPEQTSSLKVEVAAMKGETRAGTFNLTNCSKRPLTATLEFEGIPGLNEPGNLSVHEVAWTDTHEGTAVAAALPEVAAAGGAYNISLPAGMARQVWLSITPGNIPAGRHQGHIVVTGATKKPMRIPLSVRVFDMTFPEWPQLHVGGWDYTNASKMYGVTPQNRIALIAHLQSRYVDSPWATRGVMAMGTFNDAGDFKDKPSTANFDQWVDLWPKARRYCVFNAVGGSIAGTKIGEPLFAKKVGNWIKFWVAHARTKGIEPDRLFLLLVDEPHRNEQDRIIVAWSRAIKAVEPKVVIWEDPTYRKPAEATPQLMSASDVLCPNRPMMLQEGTLFADFYRKQREAGRRIEFYSCSGPSRLLDPYTYHRLQAWTCFQMGAEGTYFWAFGDTGGGDSWNEYLNRGRTFTPLFLGRDSVTPGKHMEAIRESVADFEYLSMLRQRVTEIEKGQPDHKLLAEAKRLLATAAGRVLKAEGATELGWRATKDRTVADDVRIEIGELLEELK